jgi:microcystin-dependent protein
MNYIINTTSGDGLGEVMMFGGNFAPLGWAFADGQLLDKSANPDLFTVLGATYGGDGVTTFALPDLRGRTAIGMGQGLGLSPRVLGSTAGSESVTLTVDQLPAHAHGSPSGVTGVSGGSLPHENMQPSLTMNYGIVVQGIYPSRNIAVAPVPGSVVNSLGVTDPLLASVGLFAGNSLPNGFLPADGRLMSIAQNTALFSLIGTTYGGNGVTTFALPDLRGRSAIGTGQGPGLSSQTLGEIIGTETGVLTVNQIPAHHHTLPAGGNTLDAGGGQPFSIMQPTTALNYIIALEGIYPPHNSALPLVANAEPFLGEVDLFAGNFAPQGWALANGQLLSISQNTALFSLLGTTYGGNGVTTFALPDLRGRIGLGMGQGVGLSNLIEGTAIGSESVTLSIDQIPPHDHSIPEPSAIVLSALGLLTLTFVSWRRSGFRLRHR